MAFIFAALDYDHQAGRITVVTPHGRMPLDRDALPEPCGVWPAALEAGDLYTKVTRHFIAWADLLATFGADTKLVIAGETLLIAVVASDIPRVLILDKQKGVETEDQRLQRLIPTIAPFLSEAVIVDVARILASIVALVKVPPSAERD